MLRWRMNPYVLVVVIISLVGFMLAGLLLMLIPRTSEIIRLMQWRMSVLPSYRIESELRYSSRAIAEPADERRFAAKILSDVDRRDPDTRLRRHVFDVGVSGGIAQGVWFGTALARGKDWQTRLEETPDRLADLELASYVRSWLLLGPDNIRPYLKHAVIREPSRGPSSADRKILMTLARSTPFFILKDRLPDDMVRGLSVYRLRVQVSPVFLNEFLARSESARLGRPLTGDEKAALDRYFASLKFGLGELWIGKNDFFLYTMKISGSRIDNGREESLDAELQFSRFGEPVAISWPGEALTDATEPVSAFFRKPDAVGLAGAASAAPRETTEVEPPGFDMPQPAADSDSDADGLSNELERFYGTDPSNADTDGDGTNDSDEIDAGTNPLGPGRLFDFGISGGR